MWVSVCYYFILYIFLVLFLLLLWCLLGCSFGLDWVWNWLVCLLFIRGLSVGLLGCVVGFGCVFLLWCGQVISSFRGRVMTDRG